MRHSWLQAGVGTLALLTTHAAFADVFVNEFHYDNAGTDTNEKIEVIAPAGTSLTGWKVVLYNGADGRQYATLNLSGTIANQCGGHGTAVVTVGTTGMQNGAPDGFALVDPSNAVVQFLSYEGTFAATDGPASGRTSTAIPQSETDTTASGQSLRLAGSGSTYAQFAWQPAAASSFGACNAGQTLTGGTPPPNALVNGVAVTGLAATTNNALYYTMTVPAGATGLSFVQSGGTGDSDMHVRFGAQPTTSTYDCRPYATGNAETCSFPTPQAGTYYVMLRAYTSFSGVSLKGSYSTGTADVAPTLASTAPANGATNVSAGANLTVTFSEPVTLASGWATLTCGSSGAHPFAQSGGPTTYALDPATNFGALETCTLALTGAKIVDQDGTAHALSGNPSVAFTTAAASGGYYAGVVTTSASALRSSLHPVIDDHVRIPYTATTTDTWDVLNVADQDPLNSGRILDIYKNAPYTKSAGGNNFYNREHTWPNSLGFGDDGATNYPYTDLHMLMASDIAYNSARGNQPYDNCNASCTEYPTQAYNGQGGGSGVYPGNSNWTNGTVFQVWHKIKGNVARAMFYMDLRYEGGTHGGTGATEPDLRLTDDLSLVVNTNGNAAVGYMGRLSTLIAWHQQDPVDAAEQLRNDAIYSYQGNRNPFIDNPQWVACIYQNVCP